MPPIAHHWSEETFTNPPLIVILELLPPIPIDWNEDAVTAPPLIIIWKAGERSELPLLPIPVPCFEELAVKLPFVPGELSIISLVVPSICKAALFM